MFKVAMEGTFSFNTFLPFSFQPLDGLPTAQTCFLVLRLPPYTSKAIMTERIRYAIHNCRAIDMDNYMLERMHQEEST